ncbi:FtsK/SpoIIIE family DNA translocase [Magnetospirillum gryphiswaldense]|uniref:DNA translocase FtsK n=1 Tax=Magnetospirillum gryphiswaldense TaxID=55518 RepID=A4TW31_9PROT|nr:DNA translocase FtsK [Magnetospirillum gryphiswaldense]AVM75490.1 DNA translocase FtsK [Magnetospirillum gryphiswaldense MSR-1]AVM79393.1 DNA translocase FtsK [Magnetospirillum gryphiswaldense]CAM74838.1 cell division protein FtsK [Magnetospirillum gryphiswaldense MSR-1]
MAAAKKGAPKSSFLPKGTVPAMRRLVARLGGLALTVLAILAGTALMTADPRDPSFNTAVDGPVTNALGPLGATLADLLDQVFGLGGWLVVLIPAAWGMRVLVRAQAPRLWGLRIALLPLVVVVWAVALAALPLPHLSGVAVGPGGALGKVIVAAFVAPHVPPHMLWAVGSACLGVAFFASIFALGLSPADWAGLGLAGKKSLRAAASLRPNPDSARREPAVMVTSRSPLARRTMVEDDEDEDEDGDAFIPAPADDDDNDALERMPQHGALVQPKRPPPAAGKREKAARQGMLDLGGPVAPGYEVPPLTLLSPTPEQNRTHLSQDSLAQNAKMLESVLEDFGVNGKVVKVRPGPVVTLYELEPAPGTKTSRVIGLADDIARSMSALSVRIATIPGRSVIGIELPNSRREVVYLRELLAAQQFEKAGAKLTLVLGKDISGSPVMVDLARMPHLLIAGTTGSGKSVAVNTMILSLLYRLTPEECRLIMIDPKMLELSVYDGIPHLLAPVVTEPGKAVVALKWAVREMEDRYRAMSQLGVRNIAGYNQRLAEARDRGEQLTRTVQTGFDADTGKPIYEEQLLELRALPFIVVIVDEMADLMLVAGKDIEAAVQRLAQMARAAGIHLIMATQRPSVDVITGTIKANFPTRISFQVTSKIDSRTILGEQGAEQLLGQGDMLYMAAGGRITRVHGPFVSDQEVEQVVDHLRAQGEPSYIEAVTEEEDGEFGGGPGGSGGGSGDDLYDQAVALVAREGKASTSFVQRHLQIGYNRAARLIERMETEGVVGKPNHVGKREILVRQTRDDF